MKTDEPSDENRTGRIIAPSTLMKNRSFTLIELLIVVAIIAILVAITVPNFLEAQTRAKVSRALADMRTMTIALEAYTVDQNRLPPHAELLSTGIYNFPATAGGLATVDLPPPTFLTTPIAWISTLPQDVFRVEITDLVLENYGYVNSRQIREILLGRGFTDSGNGVIPSYGEWRLYSAGPDLDKGRDTKLNEIYDPTNGTVSNGDIILSQRQTVLTGAGDE